MSSKKSGFGCLSPLGLIAAIALLGISGYSYKKRWHQFIGSGNLSPLAAAKVVPERAIMTGFISTKEKDWQQLENLGVEPATVAINSLTDGIKQELKASDINYEEDIKPWLGNAMFAIVPNNGDISDSGTLLVLGIKNPVSAYKFFRKNKTTERENFQITNYRGVELNIGESDRGTPINIAVLGNKVVVASAVDTLKQAVDTFSGEASFASNPENKAVLKQSLDLKNELAKFYITDYDLILKDALNDPSLPTEQLTKLQPVESLIFGIGADEKQLSMQSLTTLKQDLELPEYQPLTSNLFSKYPEQTLFLIGSQGIDEFWSTLVNIGAEDKDLSQILDGMRTSTKWVTGLDLDRDIFSWMDGEFGVGIIATEESAIPELNLKLGMAIVLQTSDRSTAENTLAVLGDKIQQETRIAPKTIKLEQEDITQWLIPNSNVGISYGWLDKNNVLFTMGNNAFTAIANQSQGSLAKSSKFQEFAQKLPDENLSYFYLDLEKVMTQIAQIPSLAIYENSEPMIILNSIKGVSASSTMTDSHTTKSDLVILFK